MFCTLSCIVWLHAAFWPAPPLLPLLFLLQQDLRMAGSQTPSFFPPPLGLPASSELCPWFRPTWCCGTSFGPLAHASGLLFWTSPLLSACGVFHSLDGTLSGNVHAATSRVDDFRHKTEWRLHQWPMEHQQRCLYCHAETWVPSHFKDSCPPADSIISLSESWQALVYAILENLR